MTAFRLLLLGLFVLGGPGLPLVDAVVWHGSGTQQAAGIRIDAAGAARSHADVCSLAAPLPVPGPVPCAATPTPAIRLAERAPVLHPPTVRLSHVPNRSTRPRAPPALSA